MRRVVKILVYCISEMRLQRQSKYTRYINSKAWRRVVVSLCTCLEFMWRHIARRPRYLASTEQPKQRTAAAKRANTLVARSIKLLSSAMSPSHEMDARVLLLCNHFCITLRKKGPARELGMFTGWFDCLSLGLCQYVSHFAGTTIIPYLRMLAVHPFHTGAMRTCSLFRGRAQQNENRTRKGETQEEEKKTETCSFRNVAQAPNAVYATNARTCDNVKTKNMSI